MGYYTTFELTATNFKDEAETQLCFDQLKSMSYSGWEQTDGCSVSFTATLYEVKWYEHEADMLRLSTQFPNVLFELEGVGEEPGDQWRMRVRNGKNSRVKAQIIFPEFDDTV
jgi:hypothetical protein